MLTVETGFSSLNLTFKNSTEEHAALVLPTGEFDFKSSKSSPGVHGLVSSKTSITLCRFI